jgi:hypothetical protein
MVCVCPQQHDDGALLTARLHELRWQLTRVRRDARRQVPLLLSGTLAGRAVTAPVWQSALPGEAIQVWQDGEAPQSAGVWLLQDAPGPSAHADPVQRPCPFRQRRDPAGTDRR